MNIIWAGMSILFRSMQMQNIISSVRSVKQCLRIPAGQKLVIAIETQNDEIMDFVVNCNEVLTKMCGATLGNLNGATIPIVIDNIILHICLGDFVDIKKEITRLRSEIENYEKMKFSAISRLNNPNFLAKAAEDVIEEHKKRVQTMDSKIDKIGHVIRSLEAV